MKTILAGTYTTRSASRGVYRIGLDTRQNRLSNLGCVIEMRDPSYLIRRGSWLYAVDENQTLSGSGRLFRFRRQEDGGYLPAGCADAGGTLSCHAALSASGEEIMVCNYGSGTARVLRDMKPVFTVCGSRSSINPQRQEGPHAHFAVWNRDRWLVCDLGGDCIWQVDPTGRLDETSLQVPAGVGPRHLVLRDGLAYVACELSSELLTLRLSDGALLCRQTTLQNPEKKSAAAAIRCFEDRLYVSNRGEDSVTVFSLEDPEKPRRIGTWPVGGENPRDLLILPEGILCACDQGLTWLGRRAEGGFRLLDRLALERAAVLLEE